MMNKDGKGECLNGRRTFTLKQTKDEYETMKTPFPGFPAVYMKTKR